MKRAAIYVRVSTDEQKKHGLSVDNQITALKDYAKENDLVEVDVYNDAGISARKKYTHRPELLRLINDCKAGLVDIIIFTKLDRWFRSVADYYQVQTILDECGVPWRAIWEDYETETSAGVFKVNIMLSVAQSEADRTSERIKAVNEYKRALGHYVGGKAPTGYKKVKCELVKDEEIKDNVQKIFDYYATNYSTIDTVRYAHGLGLNIARETWTRMLKNPAYCGEAAGGYKCEPYITREQYEINLRSVENRRQRVSKVQGRVFLFNGLVKCKICGRNMSGSTRKAQSGKNIKYYKYYRCLGFRNALCHNQRTVTEMAIERYLLDNISQEMNKYVDEIENNDIREENEKKIKGLEAKLLRIGERYEDGDISRDEYKTKRTGVLLEISHLKRAVPSSMPAQLPDNWRDIYFSLDDAQKKAFWHDTIKYITLPCDDEPNYTIMF